MEHGGLEKICGTGKNKLYGSTGYVCCWQRGSAYVAVVYEAIVSMAKERGTKS